MQDPFVSIIIITRNRPFLLGHCIDHLLMQPYPRKEIIVVDSSSNDESERVVTQHLGVISVRLRGQRNNMPQARNAGLAAASGDILAFVDDDAMVQPGWFAALVKAYDDETVGGVGGRVIEVPDPYYHEIKGTPAMFVKPSGRVIMKDRGAAGTGTIDVDHIPGGNMSFRREVLEQVGGADPNYTLTNLREETDLCIRVRKAGWRILFVPEMAILHFSFRAIYQPYFLERPKFQYSNGRNCMYFAIKNYGLNPRTLGGQAWDVGRCCGRAVYYTSLFLGGMFAQMAGRVAGLRAGILWLASSRRRRASNPKINWSSKAPADSQDAAVAYAGRALIEKQDGRS